MLFRRLLFACAIVAPGFAAATGPTGTLYITTQSAFLIAAQGEDQTVFSSAVGGEGPIAVHNAIATAGATSSSFGAGYSLSGVFNGNLFQSSVPGTSNDAATNGAANFVINNLGDVYQTQPDFLGAFKLFNAGSSARGITFDSSDNSLWIDVNGFLTNFSLDGVTQDIIAGNGASDALAYDPTDSTLWAGKGSFLSQYSKKGELIQTDVLDSGLTVSGMEFNQPVPEPLPLATLGLGVLAFANRRRPQRKK